MGPTADEHGTHFTTMSFNIRYPATSDGDNQWPNRRHLVAQMIENVAPDIFGLQEAYYEQIHFIASQLPQYAWIGEGRYGGHTNEHMAVFYDTNRLAVIEKGDFWLSDTPDVVGSNTWGNNMPRMVTWGQFRCQTTGAQFYLFNTHWHHTREADAIRTRSAQLIVEKVLALPANLPVILMGDFNTGGDSEACQVLLGGTAPAFLDSRAAVETPGGPLGTYHGFKGGPSESRIDFILTRGSVTVVEQEHLTFNEEGRYPSDHYPVVAKLSL